MWAIHLNVAFIITLSLKSRQNILISANCFVKYIWLVKLVVEHSQIHQLSNCGCACVVWSHMKYCSRLNGAARWWQWKLEQQDGAVKTRAANWSSIGGKTDCNWYINTQAWKINQWNADGFYRGHCKTDLSGKLSIHHILAILIVWLRQLLFCLIMFC